MAVAPSDKRSRVIDRTPTEVKLQVSATNDFSPGVRGFFERWASAFTGLSITGRRAFTKPNTLRYPIEKLTLSARWRGPLHLTGILGRDDIPSIETLPPDYNGHIDALYESNELPPCVGNCPANVDARGQAYYLAEDKTAEAYELVRQRNTMPGVLGRICHHPCETACKRNYYDEPIAIRPLHRVAYERYAEVREERVKPLPRTRTQEVAIVGSGPSGLTVALDLMRLGYGVTVYEKEHHPGGALYSGVPAYRLPRDVLKQEVDDLCTMGMDLRLNVAVGDDVPIDHLIGEYDAVLIAAGLQESRILPLPGSDAKGVVGALEFLRAGNWKNDAGVKGKRVLVVGGGNVAVDCARVALRVGATEVTLSSLESMDELPAHPWEIEEALDEGKLGPIVAGSDILLSERGLLPVDGTLLTTNVRGVFACGEVVTGPGSAIGSIASGHEAATSIHRFLSGEDLREGRSFRPVPVYPRYQSASVAGVESNRRRAKMPMAKGEDRAKDFRTVELGFTHLEGEAEAARCLRCSSGVCVGCTFCARTCPDYAIRVERVDDPVGRSVTRFDFDISKCCFCGLCAEQCPTGALQHTGQYELSFYSRDYTVFGKDEMVRPGDGFRATGAEMPEGAARGQVLQATSKIAADSTPANPEDAHSVQEVAQ